MKNTISLFLLLLLTLILPSCSDEKASILLTRVFEETNHTLTRKIDYDLDSVNVIVQDFKYTNEGKIREILTVEWTNFQSDSLYGRDSILILFEYSDSRVSKVITDRINSWATDPPTTSEYFYNQQGIDRINYYWRDTIFSEISYNYDKEGYISSIVTINHNDIWTETPKETINQIFEFNGANLFEGHINRTLIDQENTYQYGSFDTQINYHRAIKGLPPYYRLPYSSPRFGYFSNNNPLSEYLIFNSTNDSWEYETEYSYIYNEEGLPMQRSYGVRKTSFIYN